MKSCKTTLTGWPQTQARLLLSRLHEKEYDPDTLVNTDSGWPGDYEGRAFLALVLLSAALGEKAPHYDAVMDTIWKHRNERGYMGPVLTDGFNEQQFSGNSWLLRGMCEAYSRFGDERAGQMVLDIVRNLLLPAAGTYAVYPRDKAQRKAALTRQTGSMAGKKDVFAFSDDQSNEDAMELCTCITGKIGPWYVSTDVGCAFIMLDGVTAAYECMKRHMPQEEETIFETAQLIREMCYVFLRLEFVRMAVQTHATLSGLRGVVRFARMENDQGLLEKAESVFSLYCREGMTENYENYNWFTRPVHTEPCGHIDSFILAYWLWEATEKTMYIRLANRILYNAVLTSQRQNGGFGLDTCLGADTTLLKPPMSGICEAHWCCTMRGGEFFEKMWDFAVRQKEDVLYLPFLVSGHTVGDGFDLTVQTPYPEDDRVCLFLRDNTAIRQLRLYLPQSATNIRVERDGAPAAFEWDEADSFLILPVTGDAELTVTFTLPVTVEGVVNIHSLPLKKQVRGDILLGHRNRTGDPEPFYDAYRRFGEKAADMEWEVLIDGL